MTIPLSRRQVLSLGAAIPLVARLGVTRPNDSPLPPVPPPSGSTAFVSIVSTRLAETRADIGAFGFTRLDANTIRVQVAGRQGVPAGAAAAVLNVTVANVTGPGFVTVYPAGEARPQASNVNVERSGQVIANLVTVRLGFNGSVDIFSSRSNDIIVDVNGVYVPVSAAVSAGRFVALENAYRAIDTRNRGYPVGIGGTEHVSVSAVVPADAIAVVINLTITETSGPGFWTAYPTGGQRPNASSLNADAAGQTRANQAIVPVSSDGSTFGVDVFASYGGHLIVDIAGYFTGSTANASIVGLFVPNAPYRVLDTRLVPNYGRLYPGWVVEFDYWGRPTSQAVVANLTTTATRGAGFFTGYPARTYRPLASNLNASYANQTIANHAILRVSTAGVAVFTQSGGHLIVDIAGYFTGSPVGAPLPAPVNIPPPSQLPYFLSIPALGVSAAVVEGVEASVVDAGYVGHWPGTGLAGQNGHMVLFAHRTSSTALFRNLHLLGPGDEIVIYAADGRVYHYTYIRRDITGEDSSDIYNAGLWAPFPSVSLVACSKTNFLPTNTSYRIVVTFSLTFVEPG